MTMSGRLRWIALCAGLVVPTAWSAEMDCRRNCDSFIGSCSLPVQECLERVEECRESCRSETAALERRETAKASVDRIAELVAALRKIGRKTPTATKVSNDSSTEESPLVIPATVTPSSTFDFDAGVKAGVCTLTPLWACDFLDSENYQNLDDAMEIVLRRAVCGTGTKEGSHEHCEAGLALDPVRCGKFLTIRDSPRGKRKEVKCAPYAL